MIIYLDENKIYNKKYAVKGNRFPTGLQQPKKWAKYMK